jgi:hypothetical protein
MNKRKSFLPFFQENLKMVSYCPLCETHYNPMEARIIEERGDAHLIHIQCQKCRSLIIVLLNTSQNGVSSVGMITDLTAEDVLRFKESKVVSCDDVLDFHQILANNVKLW